MVRRQLRRLRGRPPPAPRRRSRPTAPHSLQAVGTELRGSVGWKGTSHPRRKRGARRARRSSFLASDNRCEFGAFGRPHTDAVDNYVADLVETIARPQSPIDLDRWVHLSDERYHSSRWHLRDPIGYRSL